MTGKGLSGLDYLMRQTNERECVEGHADSASEVESRNGRTHIPSFLDNGTRWLDGVC